MDDLNATNRGKIIAAFLIVITQKLCTLEEISACIDDCNNNPIILDQLLFDVLLSSPDFNNIYAQNIQHLCESLPSFFKDKLQNHSFLIQCSFEEYLREGIRIRNERLIDTSLHIHLKIFDSKLQIQIDVFKCILEKMYSV
jgi:hypothetical protein